MELTKNEQPRNCTICRKPVGPGRLVCANKKCISYFQIRDSWTNTKSGPYQKSQKKQEEYFNLMQQRRDKWVENPQ